MKRVLVFLTLWADSVIIVSTSRLILFVMLYNFEPVLLLMLLGISVNLFGLYQFIRKGKMAVLLFTVVVFAYILVNEVGFSVENIIKNGETSYLFVSIIVILLSLLILSIRKRINSLNTNK